MNMAAGVVTLPILLLLGLLLLGGLVLVVLLVDPRTRPAGIVLAVLGGLLLCGFVAAFGFLLEIHEAEPGRPSEITAAETPETPPSAEPEPETPPAEQPALEGPAAQARPPWVESPPQRVGDGYQTSITVGPYTSRLECDAQLPVALQAAVDEYVSIYLGPQWSGRIRFPPEVLEEELVKDQWEETIHASVGRMVQLHALLQFDTKFRQAVCDLRDRAIVAGRVWWAGAILGVVLAWLALAFAFLRIDQATAGVYRGRLAAACILAAVVVLLAAGVVLRAAGPAVLAAGDLPALGKSGQAPFAGVDLLNAPAPSGRSADRSLPAGGELATAWALVHGADWRLALGLRVLAVIAAAGGVAALLAFRRTRVIGIVLLAVIVVGALLLVA